MENQNIPDDPDGEVIRGLIEDRFDFSKSHVIDFNVDFEEWPPAPEAIAALRREYSDVEVIEEDNDDKYVLFQVEAKLTYDLVKKVQSRATELVSKYGGHCDSWGVLN